MVDRPLRINVVDDEVWRLTLAALAASQHTTSTVTYRCATCRAVVGRAGMTSRGPLLMATWMVPSLSTIILNGQRVSARRALKDMPGDIVEERGRTHLEEPHSTIALLRDDLSEYPDLLVRCNDHGDRVLDRLEVLGDIARAPERSDTAVTLTLPHLRYLPLRSDFVDVPAKTAKSRRIHRIGDSENPLPDA